MRSDSQRLLDVLEQLNLIQQFAVGGRPQFWGNPMVQSAILHRLTLLGEACRALSPEIKSHNSHVPWSEIIAFRNVIVHEYFGLDLELAWQIVEVHLPQLKRQIEQILDNAPPL